MFKMKPPISIRLNKEQVRSVDLFEVLRINDRDIEEKMREQPADYFFWCAAYEELKSRIKNAVALRDKREADIAEATQADGKAKRKFDIRYVCAQDKQWSMISQAIRALEYSEGIAKSAVKAFEQRSDLLQSLNANRRKERYDS